jgi:hypothetical protein
MLAKQPSQASHCIDERYQQRQIESSDKDLRQDSSGICVEHRRSCNSQKSVHEIATEMKVHVRLPANIAISSQRLRLSSFLSRLASLGGIEDLLFEIRVEQRLESVIRAMEFGFGKARETSGAQVKVAANLIEETVNISLEHES